MASCCERARQYPSEELIAYLNGARQKPLHQNIVTQGVVLKLNLRPGSSLICSGNEGKCATL